MSEVERLQEENADLRRALLRLRGVYDMAATMRERGYLAEDVLCYIEEGVDAAAREAVTP